MNLYAIAYIIFCGLLFLIFSQGILTFGNLISKTPDMLDRHGDRKTETDAPIRHARYFVVGLSFIFMMGVIFMAFSTIRMEIIGGVIIFSSLLFAGTVMFFSMRIYNLMKRNAVEYKDSIVA